MPLYTIHLCPWGKGGNAADTTSRPFQQGIYQQVSNLHAARFSCDQSSVRVEFILASFESSSADYGGYGYVPDKGGIFSANKRLSDYITVQMAYSGSAGEWEAYCRQLVGLLGFRGRRMGSVYLVKTEFEFEIKDERQKGALVAEKETAEELPRYQA